MEKENTKEETTKRVSILIDENWGVQLPTEMMEDLGLEEGDKLIFRRRKGEVTMTKA